MTVPLPIPAATLIVFREAMDGAPGSLPELLMVERAGAMAFAAGALVFPGGRVDPDDHDLAASFAAHDPDEAAARIAAIRETLEESGLALGFATLPDAAEIAAIRAALAAGELFSHILARRGHALDLDILIPWSRWCPNFKEARSFDTRFYLARLPAGSPPASVDETENVHLVWASAQHVLDLVAKGEAKAIFPTRRNLERLAQCADFESAAAHAARFAIRLIRPWVEPHPDGDLLRIPDDQGYPVIAELLATARRF